MSQLKLYLSYCIVLIVLLLSRVDTVDRKNFKTCDQSGFCKRQRFVADGSAQYEADLSAGVISGSTVEIPVVNKAANIRFKLELSVLEKGGVFRVKLNEANPLLPRYEVEHALLPALSYGTFDVRKASDHWSLISGQNEARVYGTPLKIEFLANGQKVTVLNGRQALKFEHLRKKPDVNDEANADHGENDEQQQHHHEEENEPSMWEESFGSHSDSKPRGPESLGLDIDFPHTQHLYGIPEHADSFLLRDTKGSDPYRLYNLDVFEYELNNGMALYGSVPYIVAQSPENTVGVLWLNAAETWVEIDNGGGSNLVDSIVNLVGGGASEEKVGKTRWMSESGIIDVFVFLGPTPTDVFRQFGNVVGTTPLPQTWAMASHQCRWNYNDEEDVRLVDQGFDTHDIPYDVMWLDIEHTDGKKYFTWDQHKFPHPIEMINNLTKKGRKMVTIIDPHIKRDSGYFLHEDALRDDLYVKDQNGKVYEGWCWPGSSSYLDFFDPKVREYWASRFYLENYKSTLDLYTWNDMNEPSVFNGPEVTMPKDLIHYGNWEHRDVHNLYGTVMLKATYEGQLLRSDNKLRPFILSRSHFVGANRYAAVWTGDNNAEWGHLKASIPMCLSLGISGFAHCGADIGGFFRNPEPELVLRWYQAAAFQPFMRNHAHIETKRREPWVFGDHYTALIRSAVRKRYALLPYWYTLFYQNEKEGIPPMRPLWTHFPSDVKTFGLEGQHLVGNALLVSPVTDKGATKMSVYFPEGIWYDFYTYIRYDGPGYHTIPIEEDTIPVFQLGGTIIPTKQRIRRSSTLMKKDPYTLFVALDSNGEAKGTLYTDDGQSFEYRDGHYLQVEFTYKDNTLHSRVVNPNTSYKTTEWVERVVILGLRSQPNSITATSRSVGSLQLDAEGAHPLVIRKPGTLVSEDWEVKLS